MVLYNLYFLSLPAIFLNGSNQVVKFTGKVYENLPIIAVNPFIVNLQ
jgi:hypothetical protein